jgi:hypothetical protein
VPVASAIQWDVFVAHASEDKDAVARPLAAELRRRGLRVWYDEFELKIGDSLRASIDYGLAHSHHGIVILSEHFFAKPWPPQELNGLVARETADRRRVILPVWHGLTHSDVAAHSPMLADRIAGNTDQDFKMLADDLMSAMDEGVTGRAGSDRRDLSLSPPPSEVQLQVIASGARLLTALAGQHEYVIDVDDIENKAQRELAARVLDELRDLADTIGELGAEEREEVTTRAHELMVELLEAELLVLTGRYERRLIADDHTTAWRGLVVRIAPATVVAETQRRPHEPLAAAASGRDQLTLNELLGLLTRASMRLIREQDFLLPWPDRITTPLNYFVHEYDEVEHQFADDALEQRRQLLLQAANHFLYVEAMNGFDSRLRGKRDGGWTPGDAEGDPHREAVLERRRQTLAAAAADLLQAYDELVSIAADADYSLDAMSAQVHPRVEAHDREMHELDVKWADRPVHPRRQGTA